MNLLKTFKLFVAAAVLSLASTAFANTAPLAFGPGGVAPFSNSGISGLFEDRWTFSIASSSNGSYDTDYLFAVSRKGSLVSDITGYDVSLWQSSGVQVNATETPDGLFGSALIGAGSYYLKVAGTGAGSSGGSYWGTMTVTAVPEPGEWALMLSGFGLIALMVRRRTANAS